MSRKRLPDSVKEQQGTLRPCRTSKTAPAKKVATVTTPPETLPNAAHQLWYVIVSTLAASGQYSPLFNSLIEAFCIEKLKYDIATREIKTASDMTDFTNDGKTLIISPYIRVQNDCLKNMLDISKRFGFDLLSMEAIGINGEKDKDPLNDEL